MPEPASGIAALLITTIVGGLKTMYRERTDVFVAGDLLWYPRQGSREPQAPDAMVVFGHPQGDRRLADFKEAYNRVRRE